mgnify:FL=1
MWVALVRSDLFAIGVYDGESVALVDEVESDVMGAHSKGGFSQARFERRRDQQVDEHLDRAREAIETHLDAGDPAAAEADAGAAGTPTDATETSADRDLIVLGEKTVLGRFTDIADRTAAVDATGDPDEALDSAVREFWTTRLSLL